MDAKSFLTGELLKMGERFKNYQFTYFHDPHYLDHFIEIIPDDFNENDSFIDIEVDLIDRFYKLYPDESLAFVNEETIGLMTGFTTVTVINSKFFFWFEGITNLIPVPDNCHAVHNDIDYSLAA